MADKIRATPLIANTLKAKREQLERQIMQIQAALAKKRNQVHEMELAAGTPKGPGAMTYPGQALPFYTAPGNVGDINRVIWPFWFQTARADVGNGNFAVSRGFSVTQEAAFVIVSYTKAVFQKTAGPFNVQYLDPDRDTGAGKATDLSITMRDSQSSRQFMDTNIQLDHVGHPRFPTYFPAPMLLLPLANFEVDYTLPTTSTDEFVVFTSFFGYRIRIEEAQEILATVTD